MRVSFIATVYNEESTIVGFLESLFSQSRLPDEIVIVDGGSSDATVAKIKSEKLKVKNYIVKFKIITKVGNRAIGRNEAIKNASSDIIVCSDAGCILDKSWIKNIIVPFADKKVDVVSGYYKPIARNVFEKCLATYTCTMEDKIDPDSFLPSSRSVAFKKNVWEKIRGYPEYLHTCEDLVFDRELKRKGFKFKFAKDAIVYWYQKKNIIEAFLQLFDYATGDGKARYFRNSTPFLFGRYLFGLLILILYFISKSYLLLNTLYLILILYILWAIFKNYRYINKIEAIIILPILQFVSDVAVILGTTIGFLASMG